MANPLPPTNLSPLAYPPSTFAKLTPTSYLLAHLQPPPSTSSSSSSSTPTRPSGRTPTTPRTPSIHTGSLTHCSGSSVVRLGDTSVVCGIRAEILLAKDIPHLPSRHTRSSTTTSEVEMLGLLVPNVEVSTGSAPGNLPGAAPSGVAQGVTQRLLGLLHSTGLVGVGELGIYAAGGERGGEEEEEEEEGREGGGGGEGVGEEEVGRPKAYWTLYIDVLLLSHDGGMFSTMWLAVVAALRSTVLPRARWDGDGERVLCDPRVEQGVRLRLSSEKGRVPLAVGFGVMNGGGSKIRGDEEGAKRWLLVDTDAFEEGVCQEEIMIVVGGGKETGGGTVVERVEKNGGSGVGSADELRELVAIAARTADEWRTALEKATR